MIFPVFMIQSAMTPPPPLPSPDLHYTCNGTPATDADMLTDAGTLGYYAWGAGDTFYPQYSAFVAGGSGQSIHYDRSDNQWHISDTGVDFGSSWTVICWAKLNSFNSPTGSEPYGTSTLVGNAQTGGGYFSVIFGFGASETARIIMDNGIGSGQVTTSAGPTTLSTGVWYHVAITYDGTSVRLYLNGTIEQTQAIAGLEPNTELAWGRVYNSGLPLMTRAWDGPIDDVRVYCGYAATAGQVASDAATNPT